MKLIHLAVFLSGVLCLPTSLLADHWTQFRGPTGNGHAAAADLPVSWSETEGIQWKTAIHGRAWSSPVIWEDQVWLTSATEDGTQLFAMCINSRTGAIERDLKLFDVETPQYAHPFNSYASPTPVIEQGRIYVTFGSPGTACLDTATGKVLWERRDFVCNHFRGAGPSPILFGDSLIMNFDGSDHQFVVALDKHTGKTLWRTERSVDHKDLQPDGKPQADGDFRKAFATPHIAAIHGRPVLLSQGAKAHYGYDPNTGRELWRVEERTTHSAGSRPLVANGLVYLTTGWSKGQLLAVQPGEDGAVIDANQSDPTENAAGLRVVWKTVRSVPRKPSIILHNELLFMIEDSGIASCLNAKTGDTLWQERVGGNYSASPILAEERIYLPSEEGKTVILEAGRAFKVLGQNQLDAGCMASPAVSGNALFLRTKTHLYRIEQ